MLEMSNDASLWYCKFLHCIHLHLVEMDRLVYEDRCRLMICILGHLLEARTLINNAGAQRHNAFGEFSKLLTWVEYHLVMSRFSVRHWHRKVAPTRYIRNFVPVEQETCLVRKVRLNSMEAVLA